HLERDCGRSGQSSLLPAAEAPDARATDLPDDSRASTPGLKIRSVSHGGRGGIRALVCQKVVLPQRAALWDGPLGASPRLKIQERRLVVLKFKIKLQRFPAGSTFGVDGLRLQPPLPFPGDQDFRFFLFHATRPLFEP